MLKGFKALSLLLSGASVSSATVWSNKPSPPTGSVSCLKAPLPDNFEEKKKRENSQATQLLFIPSSLYQIPVLSSISESYRAPFI